MPENCTYGCPRPCQGAWFPENAIIAGICLSLTINIYVHKLMPRSRVYPTFQEYPCLNCLSSLMFFYPKEIPVRVWTTCWHASQTLSHLLFKTKFAKKFIPGLFLFSRVHNIPDWITFQGMQLHLPQSLCLLDSYFSYSPSSNYAVIYFRSSPTVSFRYGIALCFPFGS